MNATPPIDKTANIIYTISLDGKLYGLDLGTGDVRFGPFQFVPAFSKTWSLNLVDGRSQWVSKTSISLMRLTITTGLIRGCIFC